MADKFLNQTGLSYYHDRAKTVFDNKIEKIKVNGTEITPDAQKAVNIPVTTVDSNESVESIKISGFDDTREYHGEVEFTSTQNGLNVKKTYNSGNFDNKELASTNYVDEKGGKIDKIKLNGVEQTIDNKKTVDLYVTELTKEGGRYNVDGSGITATAKLNYEDNSGVTVRGTGKITLVKDASGVKASAYTNDSMNMFAGGFYEKVLVDKTYVDGTFRTEQQVEDAINAKLTTLYKPQGSVEFANLPDISTSAGADYVGFVYDISDDFVTTDNFVEGAGHSHKAGTNVVVVEKGPAGYFFDVLSGTIDTSGFWANTAGEENSLVAITTAEIDALFA